MQFLEISPLFWGNHENGKLVPMFFSSYGEVRPHLRAIQMFSPASIHEPQLKFRNAHKLSIDCSIRGKCSRQKGMAIL